jgi:hypothetical protein
MTDTQIIARRRWLVLPLKVARPGAACLRHFGSKT